MFKLPQFIIALLFYLISSIAAGGAIAAAPTPDKSILVFGDSLSAGYGIDQAQSWPSLIGQRLQRDKLSYKVVNASISGETSAGGRSRLPAALQQFKPAIVVIALGANDGLRGLPVAAMRANLQAMIVASRDAHAEVIVAGIRLPPNYGPDYVRGFEQTYGDLARRYKTGLVPFLLEGFADRPDAFQPDGLHPTAAFQPNIVDNVWRALQPLLSKP
jgi:acyl-CoA thioesterase-1